MYSLPFRLPRSQVPALHAAQGGSRSLSVNISSTHESHSPPILSPKRSRGKIDHEFNLTCQEKQIFPSFPSLAMKAGNILLVLTLHRAISEPKTKKIHSIAPPQSPPHLSREYSLPLSISSVLPPILSLRSLSLSRPNVILVRGDLEKSRPPPPLHSIGQYCAGTHSSRMHALVSDRGCGPRLKERGGGGKTKVCSRRRGRPIFAVFEMREGGEGDSYCALSKG